MCDSPGKAIDASTKLQHATGNLYPTTSKLRGRYDSRAKVNPSPAVIKPGYFRHSQDPKPRYLPQNWSAHIHPEGQLYFRRSSSLQVVTEEYLYSPDIMERISSWANRIEDILDEQDSQIWHDVELFLQLDGSDCSYYFVDHATRTQFWLDPLDTDHLDISPVVSNSHLRCAMEALYWCHVEHFPTHRKGVTSKIVDDLICVFSHGQADHMTSPVSTFPYSEEKCIKFLALLKNSREHTSDERIICFVARLWCSVSNHRFSTHYGQEHARLSRDQAILNVPLQSRRWVSAPLSAITFKTFDIYAAQLEDLYVDNLVYEDQWRPFMRLCLHDWKQALLEAFGSLLLHISLYFSPSLPTLALTSGALLCASAVTSLILIHRYEPLERANASEACTHLDAVRSKSRRFWLVAFLFSLPKAFFFWGLGVFLAHWIIIVGQYFGLSVTAALGALLVIMVLTVLWITSSSKVPSWAQLLKSPVFRKQVVESSNV